MLRMCLEVVHYISGERREIAVVVGVRDSVRCVGGRFEDTVDHATRATHAISSGQAKLETQKLVAVEMFIGEILYFPPRSLILCLTACLASLLSSVSSLYHPPAPPAPIHHLLTIKNKTFCKKIKPSMLSLSSLSCKICTPWHKSGLTKVA